MVIGLGLMICGVAGIVTSRMASHAYQNSPDIRYVDAVIDKITSKDHYEKVSSNAPKTLEKRTYDVRITFEVNGKSYTLECIQYVRMLKGLGIPVIFEKEGINTADMTSEMVLTCLSSFAQAESESISLNVARGKRMGYKQGKFSFPYTNFLGYEKGSDGFPQIVPKEAEIIRMIFHAYLDGDCRTFYCPPVCGRKTRRAGCAAPFCVCQADPGKAHRRR